MNKRYVSLVLSISILLSFFNFNFSYGEVVEDGRVVISYLINQEQGGDGYKLVPYESKLYPNEVSERAEKSKARFSLSLNGGNQQGVTSLNSPADSLNVGINTGFGEGKSDFTGAVLYAQKGDVVTMTNLSTAGTRPIKNIHVQQHSPMFPAYNNTRSASTVDIPLDPSYKTLNAAGEYGYYLYAINQDDQVSENGNHWASGASNTGSTAWRNTFFKQYFTAIKVIVPNIQVDEYHVDSDNFTELEPVGRSSKIWGENYTGKHKSFTGKVPDGVLVRYTYDSTDGYPERDPAATNVNVNLDTSNPNLTREKVKNLFDTGKGLYFILTYYYKDEPSELNVDFDAVHNHTNVNHSTVRVENYPVTINLLDRSVSDKGQVNSWSWTRFNYQTSGAENFSTIQNPSMTFNSEDDLKRYLNNSNQMLLDLEARDTLNNTGSKSRYIQFEFVAPPPSGARIQITGTATPAAIPYGGTWGTSNINFHIKAMDLVAGEVVEEWHTEYKTPRYDSLGYRERLNHNSTNTEVTRAFTADVSQTNRRVWLRAELKTNRGLYIEEGYVEVPTSQQSQPPIPVIEGKTTISLGDKVTFDGTKSYSPDPSYFVEEYWWDMPGGTTILTKHPDYGSPDRSQSRIEVYFTTIGQKTIMLDVWNNQGVVSRNPAMHNITVTEPFPEAVISVEGYLKENREVFLDSVLSTGNDTYPIDPTKTYWIIEPASGQSGGSIKVDGSLTATRLRALFKQAGDYRVRVYVYNAYGNYDMAEQIIKIEPDLPPVVNFTTTTTIHRDPNNNNKATIKVQDQSYSVDSDHIAQRIWRYTFDSNNDGIFNEAWHIIDSTNKENIEFEVSHVGKYRIELEAIEGFSQPTINQFVTAADRRRGNTDSKPLAEKIVEVDNIPPVALFEMTKKKQVDLVFNISGSGFANNELQSHINSILVPQLEAKNIDYRINILDNSPSFFTKIFFHAGNGYNYSSLFEYDFITQRVEKLDRTDFGNNLMLASNGKLYYMKDTSSIDYSVYYRFAIYEYDQSTKVESKLYDSPTNTYQFGGDFDSGRGGEWSGEAYIAHDNSIYFFESTLNGYSRIISLRKFNVNTRIASTLYSYTDNGHWTHQGDNDYRIVGVDKHNNVVLVTGLRKNNFYHTSIPPRDHVIRVVRPNGTNTVIASHHLIETGSIRMNIDGDIFYRSREITNTGSPTNWTVTKNSMLKINSSGSLVNNQELDNTLLNQYSVVGFNILDSDKLILRREISGSIREYEYSLSNQTISSSLVAFPHSAPPNGSISYTSNLYGNRRMLDIYQQTSRTNINYMYNEATREVQPSGLTIDKLAPFNIPSYSFYDDDDGSWYHYNPKITLRGYGYKVNMYANPSSIRIPDPLDVVLEKEVWREHADRIVINLNNNEIREISNKKQLADIIAKAITDQVHIVGFGSNTNTTQYQTLLNNLGGKGFHTINALNTAMQQLTDYIVVTLGNKVVDTYLLLNEEVEIETTYEDKENDTKFSERWRYTHNHLFFTNSLGQISDSGIYRITPYYFFDRVGLYQTIFQVQDNPSADSRFSNYRRWSDESLNSNNIYVHRRPIAEYNYSLSFAGGLNWNIALNSQSYDLDHMNKVALGIAEEKWRFKEIDQANWTNSKPTTLLENKMYLVELTVKDLEGEWSYPIVKTINTDPNQMPPTIRANPEKLINWYNRAHFLANGDLRVNVIAQAYGSKTITEVKHSWSQSITTPGTWTTTAISNFNLIQAVDGRWYLHVEATDSTGLKASAVFGQYPIDKTPPTQPTITNNQSWTNASVAPINITHGTDVMSGFDKSLYRLTGATTLGDTAYSGQFNIANAGVTNIYARTLDVAGNASAEVSSIVRIDRIPPVIDSNPTTFTGMGPLNVTIAASDTGGSGLNSIRYRWTQTTTKPTSGWTTTTLSSAATSQAVEGVWYLHMEAFDNAGNSFYRYRSYTIEDLKVSATLVPNPAMAGDQLIFTISTEGNAERLEIFIDPDIISRDQRVQMGYPAQDYPIRVYVDSTRNIKTDVVKYVLWVTTYETLDKNNNRLRAPYKFTVRAWKGTLYKDVELELEVKRNILELLKPGIKDKYDK